MLSRPRRQRRPGQERRPTVGVHHQRRRVAGGAVGQLAGAGVEHAVEDRGALDVVHLRGEGVQCGEDHPRRRVAQRGGAHGPPQPAHRAGSRHAVPHRVADDERDPARAERDGVVPVPTGRPGRRGAVVAAREPEIGQHRQGRRQERELRLLDEVGGLLGPERRVRRRFGHQNDQHAASPGHPHRPHDGRRHRPMLVEHAGDRLRQSGAQSVVDDVRNRAPVDQGQFVPLRAQRPRQRVRPDGLALGAETVDGRRRGFQRRHQGGDSRVPCRAGDWRLGAGGGAHLGSANTSAGGPATARPADVGPWG